MMMEMMLVQNLRREVLLLLLLLMMVMMSLYTQGGQYFVQEVVAKKPMYGVEEKTVAVKKKPTKKQVASTIGIVTALFPLAKGKGEVDDEDDHSMLLLYSDENALQKGTRKHMKDSSTPDAAKCIKRGVDQSINRAHGVSPVVNKAEVNRFLTILGKIM